ncbi:hypothetical protein LCGC14_1830950 [marine sediment metagenome]|uniref:Uncharacterized protein n=1 Tax=marine sediment metagenome TaxID=412755 RepID=A0A0F9GG66_9ZZZZ
MPLEILNKLDFEAKIKKMTNRKLLEFNSWQIYDNNLVVSRHEKRITSVEKKSNRIIGTAGMIGTGIGASVVAVINYFSGR